MSYEASSSSSRARPLALPTSTRPPTSEEVGGFRASCPGSDLNGRSSDYESGALTNLATGACRYGAAWTVPYGHCSRMANNMANNWRSLSMQSRGLIILRTDTEAPALTLPCRHIPPHSVVGMAYKMAYKRRTL